jgi:hypothetical protein
VLRDAQHEYPFIETATRRSLSDASPENTATAPVIDGIPDTDGVWNPAIRVTRAED